MESSVTVEAVKELARVRLEAARDGLVDLSHRLHANPEIAFEEKQACAWLCEELARAGFSVESGVAGLPTAFIARSGSGPLHVAFCAEYDALPGVGHACGHNVIAASSLGAAIAAASVAEQAGLSVSIIGTPAEERGGGKIMMLEAGAFAGIHAAMMVHPAPLDLVEMPMVAAVVFDVHYYGKEAHAAAFPEQGINAADALTVAQTAIGLLRQHMRPADRVHGYVTKGGEAPNIVPAYTSAQYIVRAATLAELDDIQSKVMRCFEAGALATGCRLEITGAEKPYAEMRHDSALARLYRKNAEAAGRRFIDLPAAVIQRAAASTDMGNVSLVIPSIHPAIGLNSFPASNHQPEFAAFCATPVADRAVFEGALALAWTAIEAAMDSEIASSLMQRGEQA